MKKFGLLSAFILCLIPFTAFGEEETNSCLEGGLEVVIEGETEAFDPEDDNHEGVKKYWGLIDGPLEEKERKADPTKKICPSPSLKSAPYITAQGGETYARNLCRQKLNEIITKCQKAKTETIKGNNAEIQAEKVAAEKDLKENEEKAFKDEFLKWIEKNENQVKSGDKINIDTPLNDTRKPLYNDTIVGNSIIGGGGIGKLKNNSEIAETITIEEIIPLAEKLLKYGDEMDVVIENAKKNTQITLTIESYASLKTKFETLKTVQKAYQDKVEELNKVKANTDNSSELLIKQLNAKINYIENRVNSLTQSLLISGSGEFRVSELLNTRSNPTGEDNLSKTSTEGNLSVIKSYAEEKFCADVSNRDDFPEKWKTTCDTNLFDKIIKLASQIIGTLGVLLIIIAAIMLITARGDETQTENGKQLIFYTLGGLLIFFLSFIIVQFIIDLLVW